MLDQVAKFMCWWRDQGGLEPAEWAIVLGAVIVPIAYFMFQIAL